MNKTKLSFYWLTAFILFFILVIIELIIRFDFVYHLPDIPYELLIIGLVMFITIFSIWTLWKYGNKETFRFQFKASYIAYFFLFAIMILAWNLFVVTYFPKTINQVAVEASKSSNIQILEKIDFLWSVVIAPLSEEIIYRGIVMTALAPLKKHYIDVLGSAVLFSLSHVLWQGLILTDFIVYLVSGLIFALYYRKTNYCIYYPILLHAFLNSLPVLLA